jgi:CRISPR-associated exonuclease Cas4
MAAGEEAHRELALVDPAHREVPVYSDELGLSGRIDALEARDGYTVVVEVKTGLARPPSFADGVQVAAYVLALAEAGGQVGAAELAFTESRRREAVAITPHLVTRTALLIRQLHEIAEGHWVPSNRRRRACDWCRHRPACQGEE